MLNDKAFVAMVLVLGSTDLGLGLASVARLPGQSGGTQRTDAALSGTVVDRATNRPLPRAVVELASLDPKVGGSARLMITDEKGRFVFYGLPPSDSYYLRASALGYLRTRYRNPRPTDELRPAPPELVILAPSQWIEGLTIALSKLGAIEGRIVDEYGEPLVGVAVRVAQKVMVAGRPRLAGGAVATTDDRGHYRLSDLEDGDYYVSVLSVQSTVPTSTPESQSRWPAGRLGADRYEAGKGPLVQWPARDADSTHRLVISNFPIAPSNDGQSAAYAPMWFPAADSIADAETVGLRKGEERRAVDFQLRPVPTVSLGGVVSPAPQVPLLLRLVPAGLETLGFGFEVATTLVEPAGRFAFFNVPSGQYTLIAQSHASELTKGMFASRLADAPGYPSVTTWAGFSSAAGVGYIVRDGQSSQLACRMALSVGRQDRTDLLVSLTKTGTIRGRVVFAADAPAPRPGALMSVRAEPANGDLSLGYLQGWVDQKTGGFTVEGVLQANYVISVGSSLSVASITWRGAELPGRRLDATTTSEFDDVLITLTSQAVEVSGSVSGVPPGSAAAVLLFPADRKAWVDYGINPVMIRTTTTAGDGSYRIRGVPAGNYLLVALPIKDIDGWRDPQFIETVASRAIKVNLSLGRAVSQSLVLFSR